MIARGELDRVLIAGGETYYPRVKSDPDAANALFKWVKAADVGDDMIGATATERRHGASLPIHGFPLYETALWAESGLSLAAYLDRVGGLWSRFSRVAANHPQAWTSTARSAHEITAPTPNNRLIAFPYTKFMNSLIYVDLAAAVVLMSAESARRFRPKDRRPVYFLAGAYAEDRQRFLIQKSSFTACLPLQRAAHKALQRSHLALDDIACFDLYSCFPCAVTIARRMLNLADDDQRPLTLTGGLGFFGGPGNNYSLHAVATLAEAIAGGVHDSGMITSLGWFMHKHAVGIYSAIPRATSLGQYDLEDERDYLVGEEPVQTADEGSGKAVIETYTVIYTRDGRPLRAVIYGTTDEGLRFVAQTPPAAEIFDRLTIRNQVGASVRLRHDASQNLNIAELR
ncbi:MAG: hypothetical protein JSW39_14685 [Desulfobacterales bacterium]|nr:MAG: hypothetical protein JSW39_14685 [Desulfobacterales bacterium]